MYSQLVIVTLHGQTQPVLVDLRDGGGRWELEPPNDDEQQEDNDGEEETQIIRYAEDNGCSRRRCA